MSIQISRTTINNSHVKTLSWPFFLIVLVLSYLILARAGAGISNLPTFSKTFSPSTIGPGSISTLVFSINNDSANPVAELAFTDTLPANVSIATPSNAGSDCGAGFSLTATNGGNTILFSGGTLGSSSSCTVSVDVTSSTPGTHMNISGDLTSDAGNSGSASADLTVSTDQPGFSKSFMPGTISIGGRSTLTFTVDNTVNSSFANLLSFNDALPSGMVVADPANASTSCSNATLTAAIGSDTVSLSNGFVAAGATCAVSVDVTGNSTGSLLNTTELFASNTGPGSSAGKANAQLDVTASKISLIKSFTDDPVPPGSTAVLEFTLTNLDRNDSATDIAFTDDLDNTLPGLIAIDLPKNNVCGTGSSLIGSNIITLTAASLASQASCTFNLTVQVPAAAAPGIYPNTSSAVSASLGGVAVIGNPASDSLFVNNAPLLTKTFFDNPVIAGGTATLEFTITNPSATSAMTDIAFQDNISAFNSAAGITGLPASGFCGGGSTIFTALIQGELTLFVSGGNLTAGASCTFTVDLSFPVNTAAGPFVNTTEPASATIDGGTAVGKAASDTLTVVAAPDFSKSFTNAPVLAGDTVTLEFTIDHGLNAATDATNISFSDDLNAALNGLVATGLPLNNVCGNGSVLSGSSTLSFTGGTLAPGQSCVFSVTLSVPGNALPGTYNNTTSALSATVSGLSVTGSSAENDLQIGGLDFSKTFTDDPIIAGDTTVTLEFTLDNVSALNATNIAFTDNLSGALSGLVATGLPLSNICGAGSQISGTSFLNFTGGNLTAGASCTFSIDLNVPAGANDGNYDNVTSNLSATVNGSGVVLDPATDTLVIDSGRLSLSTSFIDDPAAPGGTVTLQFTLNNLDAEQTVSNIAFTDDLNSTLAGLVATELPTNDVCGAGSSITGTSLLSFSGGSLNPGASCSFSITLQVPSSVPLGTVLSNTTSAVTGLVSGLNVNGDPASDSLLIDFLEFSKSFAGNTVAGSTAVLSFTINNLSTTTAVGDLAFNDDLNAVIPGLTATGLPVNDVCGSGSVLSGTSLIALTGANLSAGDSCTFDVTLQVPANSTAGSFLNTTSQLLQSGLVVSSPATATLTIEPPPALSKSFAPESIGVNELSTLMLTIDNSASQFAASAITLTDNLPTGMVLASPANAMTTCSGGTLTATDGSSVLTYTGGSVAAGASCTLSAQVSADSAGSYVNTTSELSASTGNSAAASASLTVSNKPLFSKSFAPDDVTSGEITTLTFVIDHSTGTVAASNLSFIDNLPAEFIVADPPNIVNNCSAGTLNAVAGSRTIGYSGGTVVAATSCSIQLDIVARGANGLVLNTTEELTSSLGNSGSATASMNVNDQIFADHFD